MQNTIQQQRMLQPGDCVAAAVSGGADSVALLHLLGELRARLGITLCVAHFNHHLRPGDSDADEDFVALLARKLGLAFIAGREDVAKAAQKHGWNLEDAARRLRYEFFAKIVAEGKATRVATAHTADDQAETVLARLIRGTGLTGLTAIHPVRGSVVRPLLDVRRAELRSYLLGMKQEWREDASNADTRRLRARVRQRLLPEMEENFSRSIVIKLGEMTALARDDEEFWNVFVEERYNSLVKKTDETFSIDSRALLWPMGEEYSAGLARRNPFRALTQRIIRRLYGSVVSAGGELSQEHVEQVIDLATKSSGRSIELPGGVCIHKEFTRLVFANGRSRRTGKGAPYGVSYAYSIELPARGTASVSVAQLGRSFCLKVIDWPMRERETRGEGVVLDADQLRSPLILRNWKPGDAYCPQGRRHLRKVTRMLIAGRVSETQRALWPVLSSGGRIVWADRLPVAEEFSANEKTRRGIWLFEDGT